MLKLKQYSKEFIHNVIIHPLMMVLPTSLACTMHDKNANWAFKERVDELYHEGYKENEEFNFDLERMKIMLDTEFVEIPNDIKNLSQFNKWLANN